MRWIRAFAMLVAAATLISAVPAEACVSPPAPPAPPTGTVTIYNDTMFETHPAVSSGTGSLADPYVIRDLVIRVRGTTGVRISGTTAHFEVRNVTVVDEAGDASAYGSCCQPGIELSSVQHGSVINSFLHGTQQGISVRYSSDVRLEGNVVEDAPSGLVLEGAEYATLRGNRVTNGSFVFTARTTGEAASHTISEDNLVDGFPVLYRANCEGEILAHRALSYAIFGGCSVVAVSNLTIAPAHGRLQVLFSQDVTITSSSLAGVAITQANRVTVTGSNIGYLQAEGFRDVSVLSSASIEGVPFVATAASGTGLRFEGNRFEGGARDMLQLGGIGFPYDCGCIPDRPDGAVRGAVVAGNEFRNTSRTAIQVYDAPGAVIRNNTIVGAEYAIRGSDDPDIVIEGNRIAGDNGSGGAIDSSGARGLVRNNVITGYGAGISVAGGPGAEVVGNEVAAMVSGLVIGGKSGSTVAGNAFAGGGLIVDTKDAYDRDFDLGANNTVNGLPIAFHRDCNGVTRDGEALGQVIVLDCVNVRLRNMTFRDTYVPIQLSGVSNFEVEGIVMENVSQGLKVENGWNGTVRAVRVVSSGDYYSAGAVDVYAVANVSFVGNELVNGFVGFSVRGVELLEFVDNRVVNASYAGLSVDNAYEITLRGNHFEGAGVVVGGNAWDGLATHTIDGTNTVDGRPILYSAGELLVDLNGREVGQAIIVGATEVRVRDVRAVGRSAALLVANSGTLTVENVTTEVDSGPGLHAHGVHTVRVSNSSFRVPVGAADYGDAPLFLDHITNLTITGTDVDGPSSRGLAILDSTNVSITNSWLGGNRSAAGIARSAGVTLDRSFVRAQLNVLDSKDVTIARSRFTGPGGVLVNEVRGGVVEGNTFSNGSWRSVVVDDSSDIVVRGNFLGGGHHGVYIGRDVGRLTVTENTIAGYEVGIYFGRVEGAVLVVNNTVERNGVGLLGNASGDTMVYHNRFINNTVQARVGLSGAFDAGYLIGGNFWSDYDGPDLCGGPNQDQCPGPDGYGDTAYCLPGFGAPTWALDHYPLVNQTAPPPKDPPPTPEEPLLPTTPGAWVDAGASLLGLVLLAVLAGLGVALWFSRRPSTPEAGKDEET